jgi:hypothetical protein
VDFVSKSCTLTEQIQDFLTEELPIEKEKKMYEHILKKLKVQDTVSQAYNPSYLGGMR